MTKFTRVRKLQSLLFLGWLASIALSGCEECEECEELEEFEEVAELTATWIISDGFAIDIEYSDEEMFEFGIEQYLHTNAIHLQPYAEMISQTVAEEKISPRLLIALMEQQSAAIRNSSFKVAAPLGHLSREDGFSEQLRDFCARLRSALNIEYALGELSAPQNAFATFIPDEDLEQLREVYQRLFPGVVSRRKLMAMRPYQDIELQFPSPIGHKWPLDGADEDDDESGCDVDEGACDDECTNTLLEGERLYHGEYICSDNGMYTFGLTSAGQLAIWTDSEVQWTTGTFGPSDFLAMQADGNLVAYEGATAPWASRTAGKAGATLTLEDNGRAVLRQGGTIIWSAGR